jgi:hypothetical protein
MDNAALSSDHYGFGAIISAELLHDVSDMDLHGVLAYAQRRRNIAVAVTGGNEAEYLDLT